MKIFALLSAVAVSLFGVSCERHEWDGEEGTAKFYEHEDHADHEGHAETETQNDAAEKTDAASETDDADQAD